MNARIDGRIPMCNRPDDKVSDEDRKTTKEKTPAGTDVTVTRYSDGSSAVHWGGPCGPMNYNEFGEEC